MSKHHLCESCHFFDKDGEHPGGLCRIRSPKNLPDQDGDPSASWPYVGTDDWCGEHVTPEPAA